MPSATPMAWAAIVISSVETTPLRIRSSKR
jgi:hypothetical protein